MRKNYDTKICFFQKISPYLLNDPRKYIRSFVSTKNFPVFIECPSYIYSVAFQSKKFPLFIEESSSIY